MKKSRKWTKKFKNWLEIKQFLTNFKLLVLCLSLLKLKKQSLEQIKWMSKLNNIYIHLISHNYSEKKLIFKKLLNQLILFGKIGISLPNKDLSKELLFGLSFYLCWPCLLELFSHWKKLVMSIKTGMGRKVVKIIIIFIQKTEKVKNKKIVKNTKNFLNLLMMKIDLFANNCKKLVV